MIFTDFIKSICVVTHSVFCIVVTITTNLSHSSVVTLVIAVAKTVELAAAVVAIWTPHDV